MELEEIKINGDGIDTVNSNLNCYIENIFENIFNLSTENFIEIQFDGDLEPLSIENILMILELFGDSKFVLRVRSTTKNSIAFYWRVEQMKRIFVLESKADKNLCDFVKEFLIKNVKNGKSGALPEFENEINQLINPIDICFIGDERGFNLLFLAAEAGNAKVVQSLLEDGMNVSCLVDGKIPADIAYEKKHLDVLLCLLKANSRFPRDFVIKDNECDSILQISLNLRRAVENESVESIKEIITSNKNLRYFYDTNNQSILTFALVNKKFEIYQVLLSLNLSFGPREDFDEISQLLDYKEERMLRKLHQKNSRKVVDKHLMILMSNSFVAHDNNDTRDKLNYIYDAFEYLNNIPVAKSILKVVAAKRDFEIHFDFNRDTVIYLDPSLSGANGLFYINGRILISAKGLLYPEYRNEVFGVIIHELTHFAMCLVYKNEAKPYARKSFDILEKFQRINKFCKSRMELDSLIESVYEDYEEEMHHVELVVRSPQLLVHYNEEKEKLLKVIEDFAPLHVFFETQVVPDVEAAIPRIENEAEEAYNKALRRISRLKRALWFSLGFFTLLCTALVLILHEPNYTWNDLNSSDQMKILDSEVNYRGLETKLRYLMAVKSNGFQHLTSHQIKNALNGDLCTLNHALHTTLNQFIFLSGSNLTDELWIKILNSEVNFQGKEVVLKNIVSNSSSFSNLTSNQIKNLLSGEALHIGNEIEFTSFYIPRQFVDLEGTSKNIADIVIYARDSKIFLLADKPGSGKSIAFLAMMKEWKEKYPDYWVEFVELKSFIEVFKSMRGKKIESLDVIADRILKLKGLERDVFVDRFENGKVVFLWDAVDEIAPDFDDAFLFIANDIFERTENIQFISTRPENAAKLEYIFKTDTFSLLEYSQQDRNDFIKEQLDSVKQLQEHERLLLYYEVSNFTNDLLSKEENSLKKDMNNPLILKMLIDITIDGKLSTDIDNIYKVYETMVDLKLNIIFEKGSIIQSALKSARGIGVDKIHMVHALQYILGDSFDNHLNNTQTLTSTLWNIKETFTDVQLNSFGIIIRVQNKTDFVHRSFAEYFVAKFLISSIYEFDHLRAKDWSSPISLLYNIAYDTSIRKVIQHFIYSFILTQNTVEKKEFDDKIIEAIKFETLRDYFFIQESASLFIKFFERDERVMRILAKVDQYSNINDWLDEVLGISLGDKKSFIENNQLGLTLMRSWQFERKDNKVFADFIRKSTKIFDVTDSFKDSTYRNITELSIEFSKFESISEFLNGASKLLSQQELKEIFLNSLHIIDKDFADNIESNYFCGQLNMTLNALEIKTALTKVDKDNKTVFFKSVQIENEPLNTKLLNIIEENLSYQEIFKLFTKPDKIYEGTLLMVAAQYQDYEFFTKLIDFTRDHTTEDQFRSILLQSDAENDTLLQHAHFSEHGDNFILIAKIYLETVSPQDIQRTFLDRAPSKFPSFGDSFKTSNDNALVHIAQFLDHIFLGNDEGLFELLSRRNENGDTIFSLFKEKNEFKNKLEPYQQLLTISLESNKDKDKIIQELFETKIS